MFVNPGLLVLRVSPISPSLKSQNFEGGYGLHTICSLSSRGEEKTGRFPFLLSAGSIASRACSIDATGVFSCLRIYAVVVFSMRVSSLSLLSCFPDAEIIPKKEQQQKDDVSWDVSSKFILPFPFSFVRVTWLSSSPVDHANRSVHSRGDQSSFSPFCLPFFLFLAIFMYR